VRLDRRAKLVEEVTRMSATMVDVNRFRGKFFEVLQQTAVRPLS